MRLRTSALLTLLVGVVSFGGRTLVWGDEGDIPMSEAHAAAVACPEDPEPQPGDYATPCQEAWWNNGGG